MTDGKIHLRPHHGLCIILFDSNGHSTPYSSIMNNLIKHLGSYPENEIVLCSHLDVVCGYCPHNNKGICGKSDEVTESDSNILSYCELNDGQQLPWSDLKKQLIDNILKVNKLTHACKGCQYLSQCDAISRKLVQSI